MPSPSTSLATLRPDLSGSLMEFDLDMDSRGFVGQRILPFFNVQRQAGKFGKITLESLLSGGSTRRTSKSGYNRGDWEFTEDSFATEEHGWEEPVDDRDAAMYADYFDAEMVAAMRARRVVMENMEKRVAALIFASGTWTPTAVTNEWDDGTNATPITDVETKVQAIYDASGIWPDTMVMTKKVFRNLRNVDEIVDRLKYNGIVDVQTARITEAVMAQVFDLPKIIVANGTKNTANAGQTASLAPIWSNEYVWIGKTADTNDIREPCVGRTFHWAGDGSSTDGTMETYRDETVRADIVRERMETQEKLLYTDVAGLLSNITT